MSLFIITNQHQPDDCPELSDELSSYFETRTPLGDVRVYCNCPLGEHRMFFLIDAPRAVDALGIIPDGFLQTENTIAQVDKVYEHSATG